MFKNASRHRKAGLLFISAIVMTAGFITGCTGPALSDYSDNKPALVPSEFFQGELSARGVVKDYSGEVIRTFDADITASWNEQGVGTLDEVFRYNDGEIQTRQWTLTPVEHDGRKAYRATAGDVIEPGTMEWDGNAIHMNYVLRVPYGDDTIDVRIDDWMYATTKDTVINESGMSKWGLPVGEIVLVIQRESGDSDR
jgi:hypothetical protein